jgi:hypothetical protein
VLDAAELLAVAKRLSQPEGTHQPSEAALRRAVSTAYYAVFHKITNAAAARFMGAGQERSAGYALICRGFDHKKMNTVCGELEKSTLKSTYQDRLGRTAMSDEIRQFAVLFPSLQEGRHLADYDPAARFAPSDVSALVDAAEVAMDAFDRVAVDEKSDVLALLLLGARN